MDCWCSPGHNVVSYNITPLHQSTLYNDIKFIVKCNERFNKQPPNIIFFIVNEWVCVCVWVCNWLFGCECVYVNAREWITKQKTHLHTHILEKGNVWMKINSKRKRARNKNILFSMYVSWWVRVHIWYVFPQKKC